MSPSRYLGPLRIALLSLGLLTVCYGIYVGATIPEPPPNTDGVPVGFAVIYILLVQTGGSLLAHVGYALPAGTGRLRFGPLADRPAVVRAAAATAAFVTGVALLTALGWLLPDSLPRVVSGTYAFSWFAAVVGTAVGVVLSVLLGLGTAGWRLVRGEPVLGDRASG